MSAEEAFPPLRRDSIAPQGDEGQVDQGRSERGVLGTRASEDAGRSPGIGQRRPSTPWQRGRLLSATFELVEEQGYGGATARSISERAGVSSRTFYECFGDREDCFLATFNYAVAGLELELRAGWESQLGWTARVRGALAALLLALDREPAVARLVFVEALAAGPRVLARRARVLESLAGVIDEGRVNAKAPGALPPLVAEAAVGATFSVIHARLLELRPRPLVELLGSLMAAIVLPYRGMGAAARELESPTSSGRRGASRSRSNRPAHPAWRAERSSTGSPIVQHTSERGRRPIVRDRPAPPIVAPTLIAVPTGLTVDFRLTARARAALAAVAGRPGLNNLEVSEAIGLADQGQISRMMKRLSEQDLVENARGHSKRLAKAWHLTPRGEELLRASRPVHRRTDTGADTQEPAR